MKRRDLGRLCAGLLSLSLCAAPASAISLYARPAAPAPAPAPLTGCLRPAVPAAPDLGAVPSVPDVPALSIPRLEELPGAPAIPGEPASVPAEPREPEVPAGPITPISPIVAPKAAASPASGSEPPSAASGKTLPPAGEPAKPVAAPAQPQNPAALTAAQKTGAALSGAADEGGAQSQAALSAAFDGRLLDAAKALFHPSLPAGQAPAVAARTRPSVAPEAAPSDEEMNARMALSPLTNAQREQAVLQLFVKAGARQGEIVKQDAGRGKSNYYVVKKGRTDRVIVVGAHHDKVYEGHGTIDNWTGATMMINLFQAVRDLDTEATYVFVAFAREEEGLIGSEAFLRQMPAAERAKVDSMVNLDTLGVDGTYSWKNNSDRSLLDLAMQAAKAEHRDLIEAYLDGGDADSSTFRDANIPAITLFGASQDVIFDIIHTSRDTMAVFSLPHYVNAYYVTLALLKALDRRPVRPAPVS